jgi:hypothetical protein
MKARVCRANGGERRQVGPNIWLETIGAGFRRGSDGSVVDSREDLRGVIVVSEC